MSLSFPADVADVMELRDAINHAADNQYRNRADDDSSFFSRTLELVIGTANIDAKHREKRLLKILSLFRDLYHTHGINSRDKELGIRCLMDENRRANMRSKHFGIGCFVGTILCTIAFFAMPAPGWPLQVFTLFLAYLTWDYFHSLSVLDRDIKILTKELNTVLRARVDDVDWEALIEKLALLLGYKRTHEMDMFIVNNNSDFKSSSTTVH